MNDKNKKFSSWSNVKQRKPSKIHEDLGKEASKFRSSERRRAICAHAKSILKESLITSWPQIASSKNWIQQVVKISVFLLCVLGFVYQTVHFLYLYLSYPTSVNVHVSNPSEILPPAITICNRNRRRRSALCNYHPSKCSKVANFCAVYPKFCPDNAEAYDIMVYPHELLSFGDYNWLEAFSEAHLENVKSCNIATDNGTFNCDSTAYIPYADFKGEPTYCQTLQTLWEQPNQELQRYPNTYSYLIELDTYPEEYLKYTEPVRMQVAVHDRRTLLNPFVDGTMLDGGKEYICHVSMTETIQLEDPYDTHCVDYVAMWKKNNGTGPLNQRSCIEECKMKMALKTPKRCVDQHVSYPHEFQLCDKKTYTTTAETIKLCTESCHNACNDQSYQVEYEESKDLTEYCIESNENCKVRSIKITVSFKRFQLTKFIYEPKFESVELYSYIGGYMGMWLGLSLVSLFDLLETIFKLIMYPLDRAIAKKKRKKVKPSHVYHGPMVLGYY